MFKFVRNPIYTGVLIGLAGLTLLTPAPWTVSGWLVALLVVAMQARLEEEHLSQLHGETYSDYASSVGRFLPGLGRL